MNDSITSQDDSPIDDTPPVEPRGMKKIHFLPLVIFAAIAVAFAVGLTLDPKEIPSALIGKPVPEFDLPPVQGQTLGLSTKSLKGEVSLVNVFASWCEACKREHPLLMKLSKQNILPIHGLNYKDKPDDAQAWLDGLGNPYTRTGADIDGRVAIDWGVYGVPETFVVDKKGLIVHKHIGGMTQETFSNKILPIIRRLQGESP